MYTHTGGGCIYTYVSVYVYIYLFIDFTYTVLQSQTIWTHHPITYKYKKKNQKTYSVKYYKIFNPRQLRLHRYRRSQRQNNSKTKSRHGRIVQWNTGPLPRPPTKRNRWGWGVEEVRRCVPGGTSTTNHYSVSGPSTTPRKVFWMVLGSTV